MLGFEVIVYREDLMDHPAQAWPKEASLLATWRVGINELHWLDDLVREGKAEDHGGHGYPFFYTVRAEYVLPVIARRISQASHLPGDGDDGSGSPRRIGGDRIYPDRIAACPPQQRLRIEAWDLS